jgi:hypothetical protein
MSLSPAMQSTKKWVISAIVASVGGGIAGAAAAAFDPTKYRFPHDFGTGKLIPYFFTGAGLTLGGMVLHSPLGQKLMGSYKATQEQIAQSQKDLEQAKAEFKSAVSVDEGKLQQSKENIQQVQQDLAQAKAKTEAVGQPPGGPVKS